MTAVTLATGQQVDSASPAWRDECLQRQRHVDALLGLTGAGSRQLRADYLQRVRESEGDVAAERVKAAFLTQWEARNP